MFIKNSTSLNTSPLRKDALEIMEVALESIDTKKVIKKNFQLQNQVLKIKDQDYNLENFENIFLLAFGKDSIAASLEVKNILGEKLKAGVVLGQKKAEIEGLEVYECTHPNISEQNVGATLKVINFLKDLTEKDLLIVVVSGGGSAMLSAPYKITFEQKAKIAKSLMGSGADIEELNIVRKHLSEIKGGRLASLAYPSTVATLIFSDVVGNDLSTIASGPTVIDETTNDQAQSVLEKFNILEKVGLSSVELNETPKEEKFFEKVKNFLILDNSTAANAMADIAANLGYKPRIYSTKLEGDAHAVGKKLLSEVKSGEALIAAGETTVKVVGNGLGGRNQELVLANLDSISDNQVLVSFSTDGHDNSDFDGAVGDNQTLEKAKEKNLNKEDFLKNNDSYNFFKQVGDGVDTGRLESNVADLFLVLTK